MEPTPPQELQPSSAFLRHFQKSMQDPLPPPVKYHSTPKPSLPPSLSLSLSLSLSSSGFIYIRIDGHQNPLQRPYSGPFRIISTSNKYFTLDINGLPDNVSVDRLKPAYVGTSGQTSSQTSHSKQQHRYSKPPQEADASPDLQVISRTFVPHSIAISYALLAGGNCGNPVLM